MPKYDYDVAVIGGGAAGLTSSGICASFGAKTVLIEKSKLGGDCTWTGCIPSKSLLHIAKRAENVRRAVELGIHSGTFSVDFSKVMTSVRATRETIYHDADSPEIMGARGVHVINGTVAFIDKHQLEISTAGNTTSFSFRSAIITAGGAPLSLPISGLEKAGYLTNETIFELQEQPEHLVILGSGPIGIEMAQAFRMLGSDVTVISLDKRILIRDEEVCSKIVYDRMQDLGVTFYLEETIHSVTKKKAEYQLQVGPLSGMNKTITCDKLLIAVGRKPNLEHLRLENAGVKYDKTGIIVDRSCRTNIQHIFAAGDITTFMKFTHVAENMAKTASINVVLRFPLYRYENKVIPWVTYTDPECAHVGKTAEELSQENRSFETITFPYSKIDRAVTEHAETGVIVLHTSKRGKILGAHAVGVQAGELVNEYALAMKNGLKLSQISDTIHAYPTMLLGARRAADQFYVRLQKRWMSKLIRTVFGYRGDIPEYVGSGEIL